MSDAQNCGKTQLFHISEQPLRHTSCVSDAQNCGKMRILAPARTTLSSLRACRMLKTVVKCKFFTSPIDPFVTSDVSDVQNCGKTQILRLTLATLSSLRVCRRLKTVVKLKFFTSPMNPFGTSFLSDAQNCGKMQILSSWNCSAHCPGRVNDCVLKHCSMKFGGSLARKGSFWKLLSKL